jgi:hypothetical protein
MEPKKSKGAILIPDKMDFRSKTIKRNKNSHYLTIQMSIHQEDIIIVNICAPNIGAPKYIKQITY